MLQPGLSQPDHTQRLFAAKYTNRVQFIAPNNGFAASSGLVKYGSDQINTLGENEERS